ncbi:MAG: UDP-N-acetylmuramate--L-alanine ligase [Thermomicrobiales bacterium]|nr:MAG: UDP-N-acetylmuramate--L-alanine ligase [Thermomicrobiales bacterium]
MTIRQTLTTLPPAPARIHFVGIGGIGMSGLARILHAWGYQVSGSDAVASEQTSALEALGIPVNIGHTDVERAASADLLVDTKAARRENPELLAAAQAGVPRVARGELLAMIANERRCVAVAGSHGKSTTSAMLVSALRTLGRDPTYAVGAVLAETGANADPGQGDTAVVEADEFDHAFLWLRPDVAVITNVEYDHPDIFPAQEHYDADFAAFAGCVRDGGAIVLAADDPGCQRLRSRPDFPQDIPVVTFGETPEAAWQVCPGEAHWVARTQGGETIPFTLQVPGRHNARNALAAAAALTVLGCEPRAAFAALERFRGIRRRFELKGEERGVLVIDDYGHHPTEIAATLRAARERYPGQRLWAVFQPHTFSRTKALLHEFAGAFGDADEVMILDIYPSRETDSLGICADDLRSLMTRRPHAADGPAGAAVLLAGLVQPGDVVLTIGAGDVTAVGPHLLSLLRERG